LKRITLVLLSVGVASSTLWAGLASPRRPKWEMVRLVSEDVLVAVGPDLAIVRAEFVLTNMGEQQTVDVGYPRRAKEPEHRAFLVTVDGKPWKDVIDVVNGKPVLEPGARELWLEVEEAAVVARRFKGDYAGWKVFQVPFAEDQTRTIEVSYISRPTEIKRSEKERRLSYRWALLPEASWREKIASARVTIVLSPGDGGALVQAKPAPRVAQAGTTFAEWWRSKGHQTYHWLPEDVESPDEVKPPWSAVLRAEFNAHKKAGLALLEWDLKDFEPTHDLEIVFRSPPGERAKTPPKPEP
jgi:hypothetical protein